MPSRRRAALLVLLLPLVLSGCAVTPFVRVFANGEVPRTPLTTAGAYYLDTICPRNAAVYAYDDVRKSHDLATLHRVAITAQAASVTAAAGLRAPDAPWPVAIRSQVELLAESLDLDAASYGELARAQTLSAAWAVEWPGDTSAGDARFLIRHAVGLTDGTSTDDCIGHYRPSGASTGGSTA